MRLKQCFPLLCLRSLLLVLDELSKSFHHYKVSGSQEFIGTDVARFDIFVDVNCPCLMRG